MNAESPIRNLLIRLRIEIETTSVENVYKVDTSARHRKILVLDRFYQIVFGKISPLSISSTIGEFKAAKSELVEGLNNLLSKFDNA